MYYRLKEPWAYRGWKKTPYALQAQFGEHKLDRPHFLEKAPFMDLLYCNGEEDVNPADFSEKGRQLIENLTDAGIIESSESPMTPLESFQRYHVYPSRYIESVHWSITGKCNMRCRHCLVSAPLAHHPQLPLEDCLHIVEEMAKCGVKRVDLTGGEPLVRGDFEEIVKALTQHGITIAMIFTNASLLTEETLQKLKKHQQSPGFQLSFDGLGHHDWLRGVEGAEKQADAGLRLLQHHQIPVNAAMCIHRKNAKSLPDTAWYLAGLGVKNLRLNAPQKLGLWSEYAEEYALTEDEVWAVYRDFITEYFAHGMPIGVQLDGYFKCAQGSVKYDVGYAKNKKADSEWDQIAYCESMQYNVYISPEGLVCPCMGFSDTVLKDRFPNVLHEPLGKITLEGFYHDLVKTKVADLIARNPQCEKCEHLQSCRGGCMLESITEDGNCLVPDERCCYFHHHIGEATVRAVADAAIEKYAKKDH